MRWHGGTRASSLSLRCRTHTTCRVVLWGDESWCEKTRTVLRTHGFVPNEIEHRDTKVSHLSNVLELITNGEPTDTTIATGPSGICKTFIEKFVTKRLQEDILDVETTYVNCWRNYTHFRALYQVLNALDVTIDIYWHSDNSRRIRRPPPVTRQPANRRYPERDRPT
jgi:hypothetical protein